MAAHIIVVDNDESIREFLTAALSGEGWEVFSYDYAHVNLAALQQQHSDLIILDFTKPSGGAGWELLQLLKMEDTTANIAILITTTASQLSVELKSYLLARYIQVVTKPFDLESFLALVQDTLSLANERKVLFSSDRILPILLVEDTEYVREAVATILRLEGYPVVTVNNGLLALNALSSAEYCLILLDMAMPIMGGLEFLRAYEGQLRPHIPVVIFSSDESVRTSILPAFVIGTLAKPFEISDLLEVVGRYAQPA